MREIKLEETQDKQATPADLRESNRKCWWTGCEKTSRFDLFGWRYCFKHWRIDYKYGCGIGLWRAIKWTEIIRRTNK